LKIRMEIRSSSSNPLARSSERESAGEDVVHGRPFERPVVERFVRAWQDAFDRGDYEAMAAAYSEDAVLRATDMPTVSGREAIVRFWRTACEGAKHAGIRRTVHTDLCRAVQ